MQRPAGSGIELGVRWRLHERDAVGRGGLDGAARPVEHSCAHEERGKVPVVQHEHLAERIECSVGVLQLSTHDREVEPEADIRAIVRERLHEH